MDDDQLSQFLYRASQKMKIKEKEIVSKSDSNGYSEKFKEKVKISREMEETEEGSGLYKINSGNVYNQSDINEGSVIFVGSITGDNKTYDAGSGMVTTPTGQININDIQGTAGGTYDATTGNTFQWRVSDPGEDEWWRQKW